MDLLLVVDGNRDSYLTDKGQCEVNVERQDVILNAGSGPRIWRVAGKGSCSSPAETAHSGPTPILVESFEFAGPAFFN